MGNFLIDWTLHDVEVIVLKHNCVCQWWLTLKVTTSEANMYYFQCKIRIRSISPVNKISHISFNMLVETTNVC